MSMQPKGSGEIPAETVRVARAAFAKGNLAIRVRDELGPLFSGGRLFQCSQPVLRAGGVLA